MKKSTLALLIVLLTALGAGMAQARTPKAAAPPDAASAAPAPAESAPGASDHSDSDERSGSSWDDEAERAEAQSQSADEPATARRHRHHDSGNDIVNIGSDSDLPRGEHADSVVAILGSTSVEGETDDAVSVLGNTRVTGSAHDSAVAVLGNVYVDGAVDGDVVAVLGNVELGPGAVVGHDAVAVGGTVHRDAAAIVRGDVQTVGGSIGGFDRLHTWFSHCLLYGRPLALADGLGWAWGCALLFLGLYLGLALLFRDALTRCVETFETRPGITVVAALLTVLLIPVLFGLLFITVIGIAAIPFVAFGLVCAGLFGKAVMLAWLGRRCLSKGGNPTLNHPAAAVLIGGLIVLALYVIPVLGFLVYQVLGLLGLGAVACTLIGNVRARREPRATGGTLDGTLRGPAYGGGPASPGPAYGGGPASPGPASGGPAYRGPASPGAAPGAAGTQVPGGARAAEAPGGVFAAASTAEAASGGIPPADAVPPAGGTPAAGAAPAAAPAAPLITAALPRAGFWIRMLALLLDALLVGFLAHLLHQSSNLELVLLAVYGAIMWMLRGSTIGGIVFDLQVVRLDGRPIDWETAIVRALGCFLSLAVAGLGFFWIAFDRGRQGWHDKIAGTAVVRVAKGVPLI
jgi:uncharacterized RDD family membrane protein YckC